MTVGHWKRLTKDSRLQRSSHIVSTIDRDIYVFGGELVPREPRDNKIFKISLDINASTNQHSVEVVSTSSGPVPTSRVGSASTALGGKLYLFSGRGGQAMAPIDEQGCLHAFNPTTSAWSSVLPTDTSAPCPPARSYHCMTSDGVSTIFVHAGCPESGRLSDLWSFDIHQRVWTELPMAPAPPRGGTSIAFVNGKLYRMNGFDGKSEQGGSLDVYDIALNSWSTITFEPDGRNGPEPRSVAALATVAIKGRTKLLTLFGERDPSSLGHAGAGRMLADWWLFDIADESWSQGINEGKDIPAARGWFDADVVNGREVVIAGGLAESNERLDDVWILSF